MHFRCVLCINGYNIKLNEVRNFMAAHRKFTFENPEDSYWNSNDFIDVQFDNSSTTNAVINQ